MVCILCASHGQSNRIMLSSAFERLAQTTLQHCTSVAILGKMQGPTSPVANLCQRRWHRYDDHRQPTTPMHSGCRRIGAHRSPGSSGNICAATHRLHFISATMRPPIHNLKHQNCQKNSFAIIEFKFLKPQFSNVSQPAG